MKVYRIIAVLKKQVKDTLKNKIVFLQFVMLPVMAYIMTVAIHDKTIPSTMFATMFATMYIGMAPLTSMASIIAEEKERNTLRVLLMSNVKPGEYLLGTGIYLFVICSVGSLAFGLIAKYNGFELVRFVVALMAGVLASLMVGAALGILSKNQMNATSLTMPAMLIFSFAPMISMFNDNVRGITKFLYTQQIDYIVNDLSISNLKPERFIIIGINFILFLGIFIMTYKKKGLD